AIEPGGHYGWPYWRFRGCETCPLVRRGINVLPDLLRFPDYTLPRGLVVYRGEQFPGNLVGSIFVALWHNTPNAQRIVRIDPADIPTEPEALATYEPEPFVTGLVRPIDVTIDPTGALVVVDSIYGHVWRVTYTGETQTEPAPTEAAGSADNPGFITSTPRPNNGP
ncbi:MAG: PQQ-dependent sugar dehydrogenase, partial [Chloroflexota bacterium]